LLRAQASGIVSQARSAADRVTKEPAMLFSPTRLRDAVVIEVERRFDERGYFARTMCRREFEEHGLAGDFVQTNHSYSRHRGTLRGMHYQRPPHGEAKLVRCVRGSIYDVIIDLRPTSPTYGRWEGFELSADNGRMLYVPEGFAHGFQTLEDEVDVTYQVSHPYTPVAEGGLRHDDPAFRIAWPLPVSVISAKDAGWPSFQAAAAGVSA
jgi:dTDP-4-dehydrorhamnose 3,5-epimerase